MEDNFILGVPAEDAPDLQALADKITTNPEFYEHRYFDGATFTEVILPIMLSTGGWATLRAWIRSRGQTQRSTRVTIDGIEIVGMKAEDAERIIKTIQEQRKSDGDA